jgi:iron(III) transport system ATP-binding protein
VAAHVIVASDIQKTAENERGNAVPILRGVSFDVMTGSLFTLLGPSGSGKTTTLRCLAGLETMQRGEIAFGERTVFSAARRINLPPDQRRIGMVFQSYAIWPHMTVGENVRYPLDGRGIPLAERTERVQRGLAQVGLDELIDRPAPYLSGGQQQRVALARALIDQPELLLLDEPLSNLDAHLREQMRRELKSLQRRLGLTMVYVTHDQEEALALSDTIAVMRDGRIVEMGAPRALYEHPEQRFTAAFLGLANFISGTVVYVEAGGVIVDTGFGRFAAQPRGPIASRCELFFRPHAARLDVVGASDEVGVGTGSVLELSFLGETTDVFVSNGGHIVRLRVLAAQAPAVGDAVRFTLDPADAAAFPVE